MEWSTLVLFLHILVAVLAFGPPLVAFAFLGQMGGKEPMHANFALRVASSITHKATIPLAIVMPILGVILIFLNDWDFFANEWLWIASVLYAINFAFALFVQDKTLARLIAVTTQPPVQGTRDTLADVPGLVKKTRLGGMFLGVTFSAILLLMVWKPGAE